MSRLRHKAKIAVMAALPAALLLLAMDLGCRFWYGESLWSLSYNSLGARSEQERVIFRNPLARPDPVTGYLCVPGTHTISLVKGLHRVDFRATIGEDGYRIAGPASTGARNRPELWISGCSFTWGLGLNDEETFPWLVQSAMPEYNVRNLSLNGYGTLQALLQLRDAVSRKQRLPEIAVVVYNDFHLARNVAAGSFLKMMSGTGQAFNRPEINVPAASLDRNGNLAIRWAPVFHLEQADLREPEIEYELRVTRAILDEFLAICRRYSITPALAIQSRPDGDPILDYARKAGFATANIWVDLDERAGRIYRLYPVDSHPNSRAHSLYAAKLLAALRGIQ